MAKKKATKKISAKKLAASAAGKLTVSDEFLAGPGVTSPFDATGTFSGTVHYAGVASFLISNGAARLLIMFKPAGNYTQADIGAAASFFRLVLGKQEGSPLSVAGAEEPGFGQICIFVVKVNS